MKYNVRMLLINRKTQSLSSSWMSKKKKALMTLKKGLENTGYINTGILFQEQTVSSLQNCYKVTCQGQTLGHCRKQCFSEADGAS